MRRRDVAQSRPDRRPWVRAELSGEVYTFRIPTPAVLVRLHEDGSISRDGGSTWTVFPSEPPTAENGEGRIAVSADGARLLWCPENSTPYWSANDGQTWTEIGDGFPFGGLQNAGIGVAAYNGTGSEVGTFEAFTVGEPPDIPPPPPCEQPHTPEAGYTMLFDGTDASLEDWTYAGGGRFLREGCAIADAQLLDRLRTRVPSWWLPEAVVRVPRMPLAATGKIDKMRLRSDFGGAPGEQRA